MTVHTGSAHTRTHPSPGQTQHPVKCMLLLLCHKVKELHIEPAQLRDCPNRVLAKKDATDTAEVSRGLSLSLKRGKCPGRPDVTGEP